jgi:hypothetical protein
MGGEQQVPNDVRWVRVDKSVKIIRRRAFEHRRRLLYVEFHDNVERIESEVFINCTSLRGLKLPGVRVIETGAFFGCRGLTDVEFGDKLETIGECSFADCKSLKNIKMPSVRTIEEYAFNNCLRLTDLDLPEGLETIGVCAFWGCSHLQRIAMPLKRGMIHEKTFLYCENLNRVDLVGVIHKTIACLHLDSWRDEMKEEIDRINQILPTLLDRSRKTSAARDWMQRVLRRLEHYEAEHNELLEEATTVLELALWKANLDRGSLDQKGIRMTRGKRKRARNEGFVTSGASVVIKNVLPFLRLK